MAYAIASSGLPAKVSALPGIKRRVNGAVAASPTARNSKRLSPSALQTIFVSMLAFVSLLYFLLVFFFFRRHDLKSYGNDSDWGPSLRKNADVMQHHLENLAQQKAKIEERINLAPLKNKPISRLKDLEDTDIHEMIRPDEIRMKKDQINAAKAHDTQNNQHRILTAYIEPINYDDLEKEPLPIRNATSANLKAITYPKVNSCQSLKETWGANDFEDPFLPRIQNVFPMDDGQHIQIEAQNSLPCRNDTAPDDTMTSKKLQLQAALFQPVSIKKIESNKQSRYQLLSDTEKDGAMTRFICRFEPSGQETLSLFNSQNEIPSKNKIEKESNLLFQCPVPQNLVDTVRDGTSVMLDQPSLFLTLVPIRTPPCMDASTKILPPCYLSPEKFLFQFSSSLGDAHILPKVEDSGRWENIPVCLSHLLTKEKVVRR
jgi:hypothetical protein